MHSDWDLVHMDLPARVFTPEHMAAKGQHYIVQYSSRSGTDYTYTDAIDVHALPTQVYPPEKIYGEFTQSWGWSKTDHCQFIDPDDVLTAVHDATHNITQCREDFTRRNIADIASPLGINVVPVTNPDVVPRVVTLPRCRWCSWRWCYNVANGTTDRGADHWDGAPADL